MFLKAEVLKQPPVRDKTKLFYDKWVVFQCAQITVINNRPCWHILEVCQVLDAP